jgi:23S rRNA (uracil1939-C5)-methyltransferase
VTTLEVSIERIGAHGDGIAETPDGRLYVPRTLAGERVRVRPGASRGDGRCAELVDVLEAARDRATPVCPHYAACGGCSLQHLSDDAYLAWKRQRLQTALTRAGFADAPVAALVRSLPGTRRRARFAAERPRGAAARVGFTVSRGHAVVDLAECPVLEPRLAALLPRLRQLFARILPPGGRGEAAVSLLDGGSDVVLTLPAAPTLAEREMLAAFAEAADLGRLCWRGAADAPAEPLAQRRPLQAILAGVPVAVPPGAFLQATAAGEAALIGEVSRALAGVGRIADLFAGCGPFSLALAQAGSAVHAIDAEGAALAALADAARRHRLTRVSTERRDLFARPLLAPELARFDAVIFDPPRAGAPAQAAALASAKVPLVVAISCNPDSFARDARLLAAGGYRLGRVVAVDQFLWSPHLELAAVFDRRPG